MFPDLSYLFHFLLGTQPDNWLSIFKTFGFFLAVSFLASAWVLVKELRRKATEGVYKPAIVEVTEGKPATAWEIISNALVGLLLFGKGAYGYQHMEAFKANPASIILSLDMAWGIGLLGALLLGGLSWWEGKRRSKKGISTRMANVYPHDRIVEITVWAAVGGVVGSKLFDLFDNWDDFLADPIGSLTSGGGLAFFGGLVLGFIAVVIYLYRNNIPFLPTADAAAPSLVTGYGVGRIGCQLSGDGDWGIANTAPKPGWMGFLPDWMWGYKYPHHVLDYVETDPVQSVVIEGYPWKYNMQLSEPVYPTPFYETMMMIGVFALLWMLRKRLNIHGMLFFIYLALIAIERFFIEKIRVNVKHDVFGITMTQAEIISVGLFLLAVAGCVWLWQRDRRQNMANT